jgi:hypothetical protein
MSANFEKIKAAADKLMAQAKTDAAVANSLLNDAGAAVTSAAGVPLPKGVMLRAERKGNDIVLVPGIDPKYQGELDDKMLARVSGGWGWSDYTSDFW